MAVLDQGIADGSRSVSATRRRACTRLRPVRGRRPYRSKPGNFRSVQAFRKTPRPGWPPQPSLHTSPGTRFWSRST